MLPEDENGMVQISLDEYDLDEHKPRYLFSRNSAQSSSITATSACPIAGAILTSKATTSISIMTWLKTTTMRASTRSLAMVDCFMFELIFTML